MIGFLINITPAVLHPTPIFSCPINNFCWQESGISHHTPPSTRASPVIPSGTATTTAVSSDPLPHIPPQTSIPLYYDGLSPGQPLTSAPNIAPIYQAGVAYPPPQLMSMPLFQQAHAQPEVGDVREGMFNPSFNMQTCISSRIQGIIIIN